MPKKTTVGVSMLSPEYEVKEAERLLDELGVPRTEAHERTGDTVEFTVTGRLLWLVENAPGVKEVIRQAVEKQHQKDETRRQNAESQPYRDAADREIRLRSIVSYQGREYEVVEITLDGTVGVKPGRWKEINGQFYWDGWMGHQPVSVNEIAVTGYHGWKHSWRTEPDPAIDYEDDGEES